MQFNVGDFIVHRVYGIGHVRKIEKKQFSQKQARAYYQVIWPERTVWVPVKEKEPDGLRLAAAKRDLDHYRRVLKSQPTNLDRNHHRRRRDLVKRLRSGSFAAVCEVVRDLTARGWQKPLGPADVLLLDQTRVRLYHEWAMAAEITETEAIKEVEALVGVGQQSSWADLYPL
jgi:RNA polymerase-interacting CarD/CdnL/TRCF family regulator